MDLSKQLLIFFFIILFLPLGLANSANYTSLEHRPPPVEKVKPPVEKGKKEKKKKGKKAKKLRWKQQKQPEPQGLGTSALTFWLILAIAAILLVIAAAFAIGLGLTLWSVIAWVMLGSEILAFLIIICVLWIDMPGDPASVQFVFALLGLIAVNVIIGIAFIIWGLVYVWIFGWIIGLALLVLAGIFLAIHIILAQKNS